jgi:hypothetical protein
MDPTQCYLEMLAALSDGDLFTARERALALRDWLDRGGFLPPDCDAADVHKALADVLHRTTESVDVEEDVP